MKMKTRNLVTYLLLGFNTVAVLILVFTRPVNNCAAQFKSFIRIPESPAVITVDPDLQLLTIEPANQEYCFEVGLTEPFNGAQYVPEIKRCTLDYLE